MNPGHYTSQDGPEVIEILEEYFIEQPHLWNAAKYMLRNGKKDDTEQEICKAFWYLARHLQYWHGNKSLEAAIAGLPDTNPARGKRIVGMVE